MKQQIRQIMSGNDLTQDEAAFAMQQIMEGAATPSQIAALAVALRMKGETASEITGFAKVMRDFALQVPVKTDKVIVDTCGTGGDSLKTFNISTAAALWLPGMVVSRSQSTEPRGDIKCGSADVLEALGVKLELAPRLVGKCVEEVGIGFLYARQMHPALRYAGAPRQEIGVPTVFNILGPLTNPAGAKVQLLGVNDPSLCGLLAEVLKNLGAERALMVHGIHGLDELSTLGETTVCELKDGEVLAYSLHADRELGLPIATIDDLAAGETAAENALILKSILSGADRGPKRDIVLLNAAGVLYVAGIADDLKSGIEIAGKIIDSGAASATLARLVEFTNADYSE